MPDATRPRDNRLLRVVIPMDAAASVIFVVLALAAVPTLALLGVSDGVIRAVGLGFIVYAVALAAMGAVTACKLLSSVARGRIEFPARLWLPLPRALQLYPTGTDETTAERDR